MAPPSLGFKLLSWLLGLNFFLHGMVRLLGDYLGFIAYVEKGFAQTPAPLALVTPLAYLIPFVEVFVGVLLVARYKPRFTLYVTSGLMAFLIAGMCLQQKWDTVGTQMVYVVCLYLLGSELEDRPPEQ